MIFLTYVFSDIHGCYGQYKTMLEKIRFGPSDSLYILGDVIDRGPDGVKILQDMMGRPNVFPILGNHELTAALCLPWLLKEITHESLAELDGITLAALGDWLENGGEPTLKAIRQLSREEQAELLSYIRDMELYAEVEVQGRSFVLVHAGLDHFEPDKPLDEYDLEDFLYARPDADSAYWPEKTVVLGHTPTRLLSGQDKILSKGTMIRIDCGCNFGGPLGCLCLDTMEEFYVEANR